MKFLEKNPGEKRGRCRDIDNTWVDHANENVDHANMKSFGIQSLILNVQVDSSTIFHSLIIMTLDFVVGCKIPKQQEGYDYI
jgi:hypothetical protein